MLFRMQKRARRTGKINRFQWQETPRADKVYSFSALFQVHTSLWFAKKPEFLVGLTPAGNNWALIGVLPENAILQACNHNPVNQI